MGWKADSSAVKADSTYYTADGGPAPRPEVRRGGGDAAHHARLMREDEDILAVIMAYMETRH